MGLLGFLLDNWFWAVGGYAVAFGIWSVVVAIRHVRAERQLNAVSDSHRDQQSVANLNRQHDRAARYVLRKSGRRAVRDLDYWRRAGRHAADGDSVLEHEKAVA